MHFPMLNSFIITILAYVLFVPHAITSIDLERSCPEVISDLSLVKASMMLVSHLSAWHLSSYVTL